MDTDTTRAARRLRLYVGLMRLVELRRERLQQLGPRFARERDALLRQLRKVETAIVVRAAKG